MVCEIKLTKGLIATVDDIDADLSEYLWQGLNSNDGWVYVARRTSVSEGRKYVFMHRIILGRMVEHLSSEMICDHIDHNTLNNCRSNLRVATQAQNATNRRKRLNGTNPYKGVYKSKSGSKWFASIGVDKRVIYLGTFPTPEKAYEVYCEAAKKYHGDFAFIGNEKARRPEVDNSQPMRRSLLIKPIHKSFKEVKMSGEWEFVGFGEIAKELGFTQRKVAEIMGVPQSAISRYWRPGGREPQMENRVKIAEALGISPAELAIKSWRKKDTP